MFFIKIKVEEMFSTPSLLIIIFTLLTKNMSVNELDFILFFSVIDHLSI